MGCTHSSIEKDNNLIDARKKKAKTFHKFVPAQTVQEPTPERPIVCIRGMVDNGVPPQRRQSTGKEGSDLSQSSMGSHSSTVPVIIPVIRIKGKLYDTQILYRQIRTLSSILSRFRFDHGFHPLCIMNNTRRPKKYVIGPSSIHGNGVIVTDRIEKGEIVDVGIEYRLLIMPHVTDHFGVYINHCSRANAHLLYRDGRYHVVASKRIRPGEELTVNYNKCPWFILRAAPWYKDC